MLKSVLYILLLFAGFMNGLVLNYLCKEEVVRWRGRFFLIATASALFSIGAYLSAIPYKMPIIFALLFMCITSLTIVFRSFRFLGRQ